MHDIDALLWAALYTFLFGFLLLYRQLGVIPTTLLCALRVAIPCIYFGYYFDWIWHAGDDLRYEEIGQLLRARGFEPLSMLIDPDERQAFIDIVGSGHFLYYWWNDIAYRIFGDHYYAPIFLNIGCSFVGALLLGRLAVYIGMAPKFAKGLTCFFLIHPEVTAWSSFVNLKDTLVLTLTIALLLSTLKAIQERSVFAFAAAIGVSILFSWLRFYVPFLALTALALLAIAYRHNRYRYVLFFAAVITLGYFATSISVDPEYLDEAQTFGLIRFLLTPQPWSLQPEYSFLVLAASFHWIMLIPALMMIPSIWKRSIGSRLVILYLVTLVVFYACIPELQGPRHRYQLSFIFALLQFEALCRFLRLDVTSPVPKHSASRQGPTAPDSMSEKRVAHGTFGT